MTATFHPSRDFVRVPVTSRVPARRPARGHRVPAASSERPGAPAAPNYLLRRVVAAVVAASLLAAAAVAIGEFVGAASDLGGRPAAASEITGAGSSPERHVAAPGDTLWSIAELYRGDVGQARYVDALVTLNGGASVQVGQAVRLP